MSQLAVDISVEKKVGLVDSSDWGDKELHNSYEEFVWV